MGGAAASDWRSGVLSLSKEREIGARDIIVWLKDAISIRIHHAILEH